MRHWAALMCLLSAACATRPTVEPPASAEAPEDVVSEDRGLDEPGLDSARAAAAEPGPWGAMEIADSVYTAWLGDPEVRRAEAVRLVELLEDLGSEDMAARFLVQSSPDVVRPEASRLRRLCRRLAIPELRDLLDGLAPDAPGTGIAAAELSRALALAGRPVEAREAAEAALTAGAEGDDRRTAQDVLNGRVQALTEPVRVGVVLPGTGRFAAVGEQILEGALLAVEQARDSTHPRLELVVLDDSSSVEAGIRRVEELEHQGVVAVVGPIRSDALVAAARARRDDDLTLISPTASAGPESLLDAYTLWEARRRTVEPAVAVATWMVREMGLDSIGVLMPEGTDSTVSASIRRAVQEEGGEIVALASYAPDSTTFEVPVTALAEREPGGVVIIADGPRTVLQVAPQIVYYGLRRWVVGGDANWSDPAVVRRLDPSYSDHRLVGTYVDRLSPGTAWQDFEESYEARYHKSLPGNMFSALGYDAMRLALLGAPAAGVERRGAVGRTIRRIAHFDGATGRLHVDRATGDLVRDVFVRVLREGGLAEPDPTEMIEWVQSQRELEDFLRQLEKCKEEGVEPEDCVPSPEEGR